MFDYVGKTIFTIVCVLSWVALIPLVGLKLFDPLHDLGQLLIPVQYLALWSTTLLLVDSYLSTKNQTK